MKQRRRWRGSMSMILVGVAVLVFTGLSVLSASPASATGGFDDVDPGAYYAVPVDWLVSRGITTGTSPTTFSPDQAVTRGQMAAFLYRYGLDTAVWAHPFADVPVGVYYENAVGWLAARGITTGTSPTTFSPDLHVTRGQMAAFLYRYAGEPPVSGAPSPFSDVPSGVYYTDPVEWLVDKGITVGTTPTTFSPNQTVTRGQMATFLWRLAGGSATALCDAQTQISTTECLALVALYHSTNGDLWTTSTRWLTDPDPCTWHGVTCTTGTVTELWWLSSNQLTGVIPREIGNLTNLTSLSLNFNQLTGAIPSEIGNLTDLTWLSLDSNQLTGAIPSELGNLTNLTSLSLDSNQLTGVIPREIGNLTNLTSLSLHSNQLTGAIPAEIGNLTNLTGLWLSDNQLTGTIPAQLGNLTGLTFLWLASNQLAGAIPPELGNLTNLTVLALQSNQLTGAIPAQLGNLTNLGSLVLYSNQLTGVIPLELGNLTNLTTLWLFDNQLSGAIPSEFGNLTNLTGLLLFDNQLTGAIPAQLGNLTNLTGLHLDSNQLTGAIPPELTNLTNLTSLGLRGQTGCLTAGDATLAAWLAGFDSLWNDGCP